MTVKVDRRLQLAKKLAALPNVVKDEIRRALQASAEEVVALAKSLVPRDQGDLYDSIDWKWGAGTPVGTVALARRQLGDLSVTVFAGDDKAFYARFVEFGTVKMKAEPFFFPAYRAVRKRAKSRISRATTKAAKKVATNG